MRLESLSGGYHKRTRRVGRGIGTGSGKTSGRGHKGQKSRSGGGVRLGFEGGQMPIYRRLPKRGFKNIWRKEYAYINISTLNIFEDGAEIDLGVLISAGLLKNGREGLKVLGAGELKRRLKVRAKKFTQAAITKIETLGGMAEVI